MRWLARVFASAVARRVAYVIAALLLASMGIGRAHAQAKNCTDETAQCSVAEAQAQCEAFQPTPTPPLVLTRKECRREGSGSSGYYFMFYWGKYPGNDGEQGAFNAGRNWWWRNKCGSEPSYTGSGPWSSGGSARNGSIGCRNQCDGAWFSNADGTKTWSATGDICPEDEEQACKTFGDGYYWNSLLRVCEPPDGRCKDGTKPNSLGQCAPEPCPDGMTQQADGTCKNKDNECPAGQIKSPDGKCLPGDGQCAAGEVRGKDGTCKKDADGDGEPDPGEEGEGPNGEMADSFSGGDTCNEPPSCSGSPIMCGQARIQWRIDCNTRKNRNIAGGMCGQPPVCTGEKCDALEYTSLLMQWRSACAVEKLAASSGSGTGSNADVVAIRNALTGNAGTPDIGPEGDPSGAFSDESGYGAGGYPGKFEPDTQGFGYARTCPTIPSVSVMGQTINFDTSVFCSWLVLGGQFVLIISSLISLRIISSGGTE